MMNFRLTVKGVATLLALGVALGGERAFAFGIASHGTVYSGGFGFSDGQATHSDWVSWINEPLVGARPVEYLGKIGSEWAFYDGLSVVPEAGETASGAVQVRFDYSTTERVLSSFDNFAATPFDCHYAWTLKVYDFALGFTPTDIITLHHDTAFVTLNLNIGANYFLTCTEDSGDVHHAMTNPDWVPTVVDPGAPGTAWLSIEGAFTPVSIQVVPEPSSLSLGLLGALAVAVRRFRKPGARGTGRGPVTFRRAPFQPR